MGGEGGGGTSCTLKRFLKTLVINAIKHEIREPLKIFFLQPKVHHSKELENVWAFVGSIFLFLL
jgi:hypothetical protein